MIEKRKILSLVLASAMVFTSFTLPKQVTANNNTQSEPRSPVLSKKEVKAMAKDVMETEDYVEGQLLVVLKPESSSKQAEFKVTDFPEVNAAKVKNLTYCSNPDSELIAEEFRTILSVTLKHKTDEEMLQAVDSLMDRGDVESVSLNQVNLTQAPQSTQTVSASDSQYENQWALTKMDTMGAWSKTTGSSEVLVGIMDQGIDYTHDELSGSMWKNPGEIPGDGIDNDSNGYVDDVYGWNFMNNNGDVMDTKGHGTICAGAVAADLNHKNIVGIAPNVKLVALKEPRGSDDYLEAINYAANMGIDVINYSWQLSRRVSALDYALDNYDGIFVVCAGNYRKDNDIIGLSSSYPRTNEHTNVIKVANTESDDSLNYYSSYGVVDVTLGAPGTDILTTAINNTYVSVDGTSLSAPYVAGVAALIKSQYPSLSNVEIIDSIKEGVDKIPSLSGKVETGGRLNANKAMEAARLRSMGTAAGNVMDVYTYDDFKEGMENDYYDALNILNDIELQGEIRLTKSKTLYGGAKLKGNGIRHFIIDTGSVVTLDLGGVIYENGGIENRAPEFTLEGSGAVIQNIFYFSNGGVIYNTGNMSINGIRIENCGATFGGGIYNSGTMALTNTTIFNAQAYQGGAIYTTGPLTISGGIFKNNKGYTDGGAVYGNADSQIIVRNTPQITYNNAQKGGGIYTSGELKTFSPDGLKVTYNNAQNGGGIYGAAGADISLTGVSPGGPSISISNNTASVDGGGVYLDTGAHLYLHNAFITVNAAGGTGGGILSKGTFTQGSFVQFIGNSQN